MRFIRYAQRLAVVCGITALTGCAGLSEIPFTKISSLSSSASYSETDDPIAQGTPILLYSHIARNMKQCWLKPPNQLLTKHAFFAKATPDQGGGRATITLNEVGKDGKKGLTAFKVDFLPLDGDRTNIRIDNFRFPDALAQKLTKSVRFWAQGQTKCELPGGNNIVSVPPGARIAPTTQKQ